MITSYYIHTSEILNELLCKKTSHLHMWRDHHHYGYIHNKSHVFHWCLYIKQNITCPLVDMNFIFLCSTQYLTCSLCSLVRYQVHHSKIKFIFTCRHVISSMYKTLLQGKFSPELTSKGLSQLTIFSVYTLEIFSQFRSLQCRKWS